MYKVDPSFVLITLLIIAFPIDGLRYATVRSYAQGKLAGLSSYGKAVEMSAPS